MIRKLIASLVIFSFLGYVAHAQEDAMSSSTPANPNTIIGDGTGVANIIPKYSSATGLTNSSITDDGAVITTGEALVLNGNSITNLTVTQGTLPGSSPWLSHTATWNTSGVFTDHFVNITDSGPANAASLLMDLQVGGASKFNITKAGSINNASSINAGTSVSAASGSFVRITGANKFQGANGVVQFQNSGSSANLYFQMGTSATRPTVNTGFGTSPVINANASDTAGSINVGTGGAVLTGTINFTQTWVAAPFCLAQDTTGFVITHATATTTVLTITATANWAASSIIVWHCIAAN